MSEPKCSVNYPSLGSIETLLQKLVSKLKSYDRGSVFFELTEEELSNYLLLLFSSSVDHDLHYGKWLK